MKYTYTITFPREPNNAIKKRVKAAGLKYTPCPAPCGGHGGVAGHWQGQMTPAQANALNLPTTTHIVRR